MPSAPWSEVLPAVSWGGFQEKKKPESKSNPGFDVPLLTFYQVLIVAHLWMVAKSISHHLETTVETITCFGIYVGQSIIVPGFLKGRLRGVRNHSARLAVRQSKATAHPTTSEASPRSISFEQNSSAVRGDVLPASTFS